MGSGNVSAQASVVYVDGAAIRCNAEGGLTFFADRSSEFEARADKAIRTATAPADSSKLDEAQLGEQLCLAAKQVIISAKDARDGPVRLCRFEDQSFIELASFGRIARWNDELTNRCAEVVRAAGPQLESALIG